MSWLRTYLNPSKQKTSNVCKQFQRMGWANGTGLSAARINEVDKMTLSNT
jgi:hypothetical protein